MFYYSKHLEVGCKNEAKLSFLSDFEVFPRIYLMKMIIKYIEIQGMISPKYMLIVL